MREWTRETPWRQGHLLPHEAVAELGLLHSEHPDETVVIVATHDCDLAQTVDREPYVEVVVGRQIPQADGNFTHAKAARTLHVEIDGASQSIAEFFAIAKRPVAKTALVEFEPATAHRLSPAALTTFQRWLAARYRRSAFPDEFERRLKDSRLDREIAKIVRPLGSAITAVLFDIDEGAEIVRSGAEDVYTLDITLLYAAEPDPDVAEKAVETAGTAIKAAFERKLHDESSDTWKEIELRYLDVVSEEAFTYRQLKLMKPWRLEHISLGADPQQPVLAD